MFLSDHLVLASLALLILLVLAVLALVLRAATRAEATGPAAAHRAVPQLRLDSLRQSFRQAVELVEANLASRAQRYQLPWVLVLDEGDDASTEGQLLPLAEAGVASALGSDATARVATPGLAWHFFDRGLVLDVQGTYLSGNDENGQEQGADRTWDELLGLCRDYRPERPFDALVVTVPAALLLDPNPDARLALQRLAKRAHRRLWLAQNRFAMRFSLYVVVSGCEHIPGFGAYARALPDMLRRCMLGWSSPYDLAASYRPDWIGEALAHLRRVVTDSTAECLAQPGEHPDAAQATAMVLLPGRLQDLQAQLQLYVDELMRPSAYHEPFILRGLYLCGDASRAAAPLRAGDPALDAADTAPEVFADPADSLVPAPARQPVFLRDLFEEKIFQERGLTRPSGTQHLTRPLLSRSLRWSAWGLVGVWATGLVVGSAVLHRQTQVLEQVLGQLHADLETHWRASRTETPLDPDWQRRRAVGLLQTMELLDDRRLWSLFMPGSWPAVETLHTRLRERLELAFGELAVGTLRAALYQRVAELTGVPQETSSGELIAGAACAPPPLPAAAARPTLGFEDLPEFALLLEQVAASVRIDQAVSALQRLTDPAGHGGGADLQLLVRHALGTDLPGQPDQAAALFRSRAARATGLGTQALQQALRCAVLHRAQALWQRGLNANDLLATRRQIAHDLAGRLEPADTETDEDTVAGWRELLARLRAADALLQRGGGEWLQGETLQPGKAWTQMLARVAAAPLLGPTTAQRLREDGDQGLRTLQAELTALDTTPLGQSLAWDERDGRWAMGPGLSGLRDALGQLFALPLMSQGSPRPLGDGSAGLLAWDPARLDQALASADLRKRLQGEVLPKVPAELRDALHGLIDQQIAAQVIDLVAMARIPGGRSTETTADGERGRLARLLALLDELGATRDADDLRELLASDALARLRRLDDALQRAELYTPAGRGFAQWGGERGPAYTAFAQPDTAALASYLGQQRARLESLDQDAAPLLQALGGRAGAALERWTALHRDLERYRLKNPNSSLLALENWLLGLADLDADNCATRTQQRPGAPARSGDLFAERQQQLAAALAQRCTELRTLAQRDALNRFATLFNQQAAGRPPFAAPGWGPEAAALEVDELAALLPAWDQTARAWRDAGADPRLPQALAVRRFSEQMDRARAFLAPLLPAEEATPAAYDLHVEFRANPAGEVAGNQVIDWALEVGPQRLGWREPPRPLRWSPGQPIALVLRLAKDGPLQPQTPATGPANAPGLPPSVTAPSLEGRTVVQRYADPWALWSWLQRHREAEPTGRGDARSALLKVEFPLGHAEPAPGTPVAAGTAPAASGVAGNAASRPPLQARVFLRLTVTPPGKRQPLPWPVAWPARAPEPGALPAGPAAPGATTLPALAGRLP